MQDYYSYIEYSYSCLALSSIYASACAEISNWIQNPARKRNSLTFHFTDVISTTGVHSKLYIHKLFQVLSACPSVMHCKMLATCYMYKVFVSTSKLCRVRCFHYPFTPGWLNINLLSLFVDKGLCHKGVP